MIEQLIRDIARIEGLNVLKAPMVGGSVQIGTKNGGYLYDPLSPWTNDALQEKYKVTSEWNDPVWWSATHHADHSDDNGVGEHEDRKTAVLLAIREVSRET